MSGFDDDDCVDPVPAPNTLGHPIPINLFQGTTTNGVTAFTVSATTEYWNASASNYVTLELVLGLGATVQFSMNSTGPWTTYTSSTTPPIIIAINMPTGQNPTTGTFYVQCSGGTCTIEMDPTQLCVPVPVTGGGGS